MVRPKGTFKYITEAHAPSLSHVILVVKPRTPEVVLPTRDIVPLATPLPNAVGLFIRPSAGS